MGVKQLPSRACRAPKPQTVLLTIAMALLLLGLWWGNRSGVLYEAWTLASLPLLWSRHAGQFYLSAQNDAFDVTFANYSVDQTSAAPFPDRVPPVLHHISLGSGAAAHEKWMAVRQSCLDLHPDWKAFLWTDDAANDFVAHEYPELFDMWLSYRYPIQKIDALRYMLLYRYGGVILDMDLECKRAFGPLRRFEFVAPAAHPTGFSIGFMMAAKANPFVGALVANLRRYNRNWLGLPYPAVMFSTGCHYASTIHALQPNRTSLKILGGTPHNPKLHRLNGPVSTPLFNHLGSSSWHSYDAAMFVSLGKKHGGLGKLSLAAGVCGTLVFVTVRRVRRRRRRRRRGMGL